MRPMRPMRPMEQAAHQVEQLRIWLARGGSWGRDEWVRLRPQIALVWRFIRERWKTLWLQTHPAQAVAEALIPQALALVWALVIITSQFGGGVGPVYGRIIVAVFISGVASLLWAAFRMRLAERWRRRLLINLAAAFVLAIAPTIILSLLVHTTLSGAPPAQIRQASARSAAVDFLLSRYSLLWLLVLTGAFLFVRTGISLLVWWNRLRRRSLVWSLTNAHLLVVVIGSCALCGFIVVTNVYFTHSIEPQILPILVFMGILTVIAVLVVMPPSLLFSYIFARRTTRRLRALATATNTLRAGDYSVRVPVEGADEVAQLQANFNAMATDLAAAVRDLEAERDTVSHLLDARRELVASVSHELRTPVSTLRGYLESARARWDANDAPPTSLRHDLDIMEHETRRLQTLIEDLFTLSRAEVSKLELRCVPADVGDEVRRIAETVAPLAWQSGRVEVVAEVAPDLPLALVDSNRLNQVLQNLLHNGIRHTPPGGIVAISASADAKRVLLQVKDTGEGIAADDLPHIWERFYRSDRARMQSASGSGLGLALVKELTEAMGGGVSVESTPGKGSCFTVAVPRATDLTPSSSAARQRKPPSARPTPALTRATKPARTT
jgi:signal transduction histidine kinase